MNQSRMFPELDGLTNIFPNMKVLNKVGQGGVCSVFELLDTTHDRLVALKIMHASIVRDAADLKRTPEMMQRFHQECRLGSELPKRGIARIPRVYTDFKLGERPAVLMEYIRGIPLNQMAPVSDIKAGLAMIHQVSETLMRLHAEEVIHGDLTPENTILDKQGTVWILDLGIARTSENRWPKIIDDERPVHGKLRYTAPEILHGNLMMTQSSDIYTMGVFMMFLLTGNFPPPDQLAPDNTVRLPDDVIHDLCVECLSTDPLKRPGSQSVYDTVDNLWSKKNTQRAPAEFLAQWQSQSSGSGTVVFPEPHDKPSVTTNIEGRSGGDSMEYAIHRQNSEKTGEDVSAVDPDVTPRTFKPGIRIAAGAALLVLIAVFVLIGVLRKPSIRSENADGPAMAVEDPVEAKTLSEKALTIAESGNFSEAVELLEKEGFTNDDYLVRLLKTAQTMNRPAESGLTGDGR